MKVLITGGAGFVGTNLSRELLRRHHEVVVLDNLSTGRLGNLDGLAVDFRKGSVIDPRAVAAAAKRADAIVHLAALPRRANENPRRDRDINATGTMVVLEAARTTSAHVIVASSSSVYGLKPRVPVTPELPCMPVTPDAAGKLAAESYAFAYHTCFGLDCCVFRLFSVFGPFQFAGNPGAVIPSFIVNALHGLPLTVYGDGEQSRDFTFADSVAEVLAEAVERRVTGAKPVNLAFGTRTSINEVVRLLSDLLGRSLEVRYRPPRSGDVRHCYAEPGALAALFPSVRPVPLAHGLVRTISWLENQLPVSEVPA